MKKRLLYIILILGIFFPAGCQFFNKSGGENHIARVNDIFLDKEEVISALPKNLSSEDSLIFINNYINRWATKQLLLEGARRNLPQSKQDEYDNMVRDYRVELYTEAYKDMILATKMDTVITENQLVEYYENHKETFKLKEDLVQLRYVKLSKDFPAKDKIKELITRFSNEDQQELHHELFKMEGYSLNDSVWVRKQTVYESIEPLNKDKENIVLKKDKYLELNDSLSLYLIFISDVRFKDEQAPMFYVEPTLKQIILNRRKLQFAKEFEKDITKDALENNKFEIYN